VRAGELAVASIARIRIDRADRYTLVPIQLSLGNLRRSEPAEEVFSGWQTQWPKGRPQSRHGVSGVQAAAVTPAKDAAVSVSTTIDSSQQQPLAKQTRAAARRSIENAWHVSLGIYRNTEYRATEVG